VFTVGDADLASHSRGSESARLAVAYVALDEKNPAYALASVAHEICHALGARDLYDPGDHAAELPGRLHGAVPGPALPASASPRSWRSISPSGAGRRRRSGSLDELRIGYRTGGGPRLDRRRKRPDRFYQPPETTPEDLLDEGELLP
jgi:hypothetical protein